MENERERDRNESKCRKVVEMKKTGREIEEDERIGFKTLHSHLRLRWILDGLLRSKSVV